MNLPIDVVVDLLMANTYRFADIVCVHTAEVGQSMTIKADTLDDLRTKVREYLLTLVPKPVLLSECEEGGNVLRFGDGKILIRRFAQHTDGAVVARGVTLRRVSEAHEIGSVDGDPNSVVAEDFLPEETVLSFSKEDSLDVLMEELATVRLRFNEKVIQPVEVQ